MHRATRRAPDAATFQPGDRRRGSSRRRRLTLAIGAAVTSAVATAAVSTALAAAPTSGPGSVVPAQDPFYTAPANIASYAPGQIVASRAVTLSLSTPSNAWQISYRSDDSHGNPEMAVTTLVVPTAPWTGLGTRPAVSYEIAEDSTGTQCAPSYQMASTGGAGSVLSIFLKSLTEEHMVKGAVLHGTAPRLIHIDGIDVEAPLERNLIYLRNRDVPGVIGKVGTILGEGEINIADFSLGRRSAEASSESREAIAVVHVDGRVPNDVLRKLEEIPAVRQAKAVRLF